MAALSFCRCQQRVSNKLGQQPKPKKIPVSSLELTYLNLENNYQKLDFKVTFLGI